MEFETLEEILERQKEIEQELIELLALTGSAFTLDHVKDVIYHEEETDDMQKVIMMFDDGNPENLSNVLETVTDAWNYFPHEVLNNFSPAEILLKHRLKNSPN